MSSNKIITLSDYTDEELEKELERRSAARNVPQPKEHMNFDKLVTACQRYIRRIEIGSSSTDYFSDVIDSALEAVYGKEVFDWIHRG